MNAEFLPPTLQFRDTHLGLNPYLKLRLFSWFLPERGRGSGGNPLIVIHAFKTIFLENKFHSSPHFRLWGKWIRLTGSLFAVVRLMYNAMSHINWSSVITNLNYHFFSLVYWFIHQAFVPIYICTMYYVPGTYSGVIRMNSPHTQTTIAAPKIKCYHQKSLGRGGSSFPLLCSLGIIGPSQAGG